MFKKVLTSAESCDIIQTTTKNTVKPEPPQSVQGKRKRTMYLLINSLIASIKTTTAKYSVYAFSRLVDLEKIADDYNSYNRIDTRYSAIAEIDEITDSLISDIENDFYTDTGIYDKSSAAMVINVVYDIFLAFTEWTDAMSDNSHSVSFWNV